MDKSFHMNQQLIIFSSPVPTDCSFDFSFMVCGVWVGRRAFDFSL